MGVTAAEAGRHRMSDGDVARLQARMIGFLYIVIAILAAFAEVYVRGGMIVSGDASRTAANILANQQLYRAAGVADLIVLACDIAIAVLLYTLLKNVGRNVALLAAAFRLSLVAVNGGAVVTHFAPVMLLRGDVSLAALRPEQLQALALFSLKLHSVAYSIAIVFFGIHCVLVGYLIYRSGFIPRVFGALWVLAGTIYLVHSMADLLAVRLPGSTADILLLIAGVSELSLAPWLLIVAVNPANWQARTKLGHAA